MGGRNAREAAVAARRGRRTAQATIPWDADAHESDSGWLSYLVFPGGSAGMDVAIQAAGRVLDRTTRGADFDRWFFQRGSDERGPHVRIRVRPRVGREASFQRRYERVISACLADLRRHTPVHRQPLLPTARESSAAAHLGAYRTGYEREFERLGGIAGADRAERLFQVSSHLAVEVLPLLAPARSRAGFALAMMEAAIDVALAPDARRVFWSAYVRYWISDETPEGQRLRVGLARQAARIGEDLRDVGDGLRANPGVQSLVTEYQRSLAATLQLEVDAGFAPSDDLVSDHVHLTNNRIGISPVEETLLALVLLQGLGEAAPDPEEPGPAPMHGDRAATSRGRAAPADGPDDQDLAVEMHDVFKSYGAFEALRGVSLSVRRGEVFGLVGPNGAGKTTLLECIVGLRKATSGTIRVLGADPRKHRAQLLARIGIQPQKAELFTHITAGEILDLWCAMFPKSPGVESILRQVSLEGKAGARTSRLSGGQRQRLVLGLALASDPELLFLDEPGAGLDLQAREDLHDTIRALRADGRTIVVATHDMMEADALCDRLAILVSGKIQDCDTPEHLISSWLPEQTLVFRVTSQPRRDLLERLRGATDVAVSAEGEGWEVRIKTMRTDALLTEISENDAIRPIGGVSVQRHGLSDVVRKVMRDADDDFSPKAAAEDQT
jgi:ABC-2 type transport system ATP-binding protein